MKHRKFLFGMAICIASCVVACSDDNEGTIVEHCGNAVLDAGELCDDANAASGDGCSASCQIEDGYVCKVVGEACVLDDVAVLCGNGALDAGETCDDANSASNDGCSATCQIEDGYLCEVPGKACVLAPRCGDGHLDSGEGCDDGNTDSEDGCSVQCAVEEGYTCPKPGYACTPTSCGDGSIDTNEACDNGDLNTDYSSDPSDCSTSCQLPHFCGDGLFDFIDRDNAEECDSGLNDTSTEYNGCTKECKKSLFCGDSRVSHAETCDDGNAVSADGCSDVCQLEANYLCPKPGEPCFKRLCGNGELDASELCDDGNLAAGDGCSANCILERGYVCPEVGKACVKTCGDGVINAEAGEQCEDGNKVSGDGCSEFCVVEPGYICSDIGKPCNARSCGDGILARGEGCDDGNMISGDGCSNRCARETGYICPKPGTPCVLTVCGDGKVQGDEKCDEGKNITVGCVKCQIQTGWQCLVPGAACTKDAVCGNGKLEGSETCDEGPKASAGCVACVIQASWICETPGKPCVKSTCGDGKLAHGEECDDGNLKAGDGCDPFCKREAIFTCAPDGSCKPICGDGITVWEAGEACDDGNLISGDGCSSACTVEQGFQCTEYSLKYPAKVELPATFRDFRAYDASVCKNGGGKKIDGCIYAPEVATYGGNFAANAGHPDFERINNNEKDMVKAILGTDGLPVFNKSTVTGLTDKSFHMWYRDYPGINKTVKGNLTLSVTDTVNGVYTYDSAAFFPLTNQAYGNSDGYNNNFHFTTHIQTYFKYTGKASTLSFRGDDDVWVFVNGKRAIDLGGCHGATDGSFTLLSQTHPVTGFKYDPNYDLHEGGIYPISFFQAERKTAGSNFLLTLAGFLNMGTATCGAVCGDGLIRGSEECDAGKVTPAEAAKLGCVNCKIVPYCGNGKIEGLEHCDDPSDKLCIKCKYATCGNGVKEGKEQCDGSSGVSGSQICLSNCRISGCGDGLVDAASAEECDDGNLSNDDMCTNACKRPFCGDGVVSVSLGEVCDNGINDGSYNGCGMGCAYLPPRCGDALISTENGEQCDDGTNNGSYGTCMPSCKFGPRCGDGIVQEPYEQCDFAAAGAPANCSKNCRIEIN